MRMIRAVVPAAVAGVLMAGWPGAAQAQGDGWELNAIKAPAAQRISTGDGVTVAVVDTGVGEHPDLAGKVIDGWAAEGMATEHEDLDGHGTAVAGKLAEVAPGARIMPIRTGTGGEGVGGIGAEVPMIDGLTWAVDNGAQVINISSGIDYEHDALRDAVQYALDNDVLVVASAGNDPDQSIWWPAAFPGVVAVTGTDTANASWEFATTGPEAVLAAPADVMPTLVPQETGVFADENQPLYKDSTGTSLGGPMVAGVAALIRAEHPDLDMANVINRLISTAEDLGDPGRDDAFGFGLVNAETALTAEVEAVDSNPLGEPGGSSNSSTAAAETTDADGAAEPDDASEQAVQDDDGSVPSAVLIVGVAAGVLITIAGLVVVLLVWRKQRSAPHHYR